MDVWPYVNGKALFNQVNLREMEATDMLDVIHFLLEEDSHYVSEESMKSRSGLRVAVYRDFYGIPYKYEYKEPKKKNNSASGGQYVADYGDPDSMEYMSDAESRKAFTPAEMEEPMKPPAQAPTDFDPYADNPFAGILDAPMN